MTPVQILEKAKISKNFPVLKKYTSVYLAEREVEQTQMFIEYLKFLKEHFQTLTQFELMLGKNTYFSISIMSDKIYIQFDIDEVKHSIGVETHDPDEIRELQEEEWRSMSEKDRFDCAIYYYREIAENVLQQQQQWLDFLKTEVADQEESESE